MIDKHHLALKFNRASGTYAKHAILQQTIMQRLLARLELMNIQPKTIMDAGSGIGTAAKQLGKHYPKADILNLDLSLFMLEQAKTQSPKFFSKQKFICADLEQLPFASSTVDMVFSNLVLQWCDSLVQAFSQIKSVLSKQGLFLFTTLGPDTLKELRASWAEVDDQTHVNTFMDMHDIGDALVQVGFVEPVLDVEYIVCNYQDCKSLMYDLKKVGANHVNGHEIKGLGGKNKMQKMYQAYEQFRQKDQLPATYEVIYGHAWLPQSDHSLQTNNEYHIPLTAIKRKK